MIICQSLLNLRSFTKDKYSFKNPERDRKKLFDFGSIKIDLNKLIITNNQNEFKINNTERILDKMISNPGKILVEKISVN